MKDEQKGLIHIYCGDGKGKSTAAFGLAIRCAGYGQKVLVLQFLKGWDSGELRTAERLPEIHLLRGDASNKFVFQMDGAEKDAVRQKHNEILKEALELLLEGGYRMLVLDEIMSAWELELLDRDLVLRLLHDRPENVEVVMTGRNPPDELTALADYISEIRKVRHPYDRGIGARKYVEF